MKRQKFSREYKLEAVKQVRERGVSSAAVAPYLGIGANVDIVLTSSVGASAFIIRAFTLSHLSHAALARNAPELLGGIKPDYARWCINLLSLASLRPAEDAKFPSIARGQCSFFLLVCRNGTSQR
jgi:hypothetical protein